MPDESVVLNSVLVSDSGETDPDGMDQSCNIGRKRRSIRLTLFRFGEGYLKVVSYYAQINLIMPASLTSSSMTKIITSSIYIYIYYMYIMHKPVPDRPPRNFLYYWVISALK